MSRRVALYFRVSTADQTPDAQIRELRIYAEQRGFDVVAEFVDTASGATKSRPELDRLMTIVRKRLHKVLTAGKTQPTYQIPSSEITGDPLRLFQNPKHILTQELSKIRLVMAAP